MTLPKIRFCHRGHDTFAERGRTPSGDCRLCRNIKSAQYRVSRKSAWPKASRLEPKLPFPPLRDALRGRGLLVRVDPTTRSRWALTGVPLSTVDWIACTMLSQHPCELYGAEWFEIGAA